MLAEFEHCWCIDFEFSEPDGEVPKPWCAVGYCVKTGQQRTWRFDDPGGSPVYTSGSRDLVVAYSAEAEGKCIRQLGWPMPVHCIDLLTQFRALKNSFTTKSPSNILAALIHFGLPGVSEVEKHDWRVVAIRGAPFTSEEMTGLLAYCLSDVLALARLLPHLINVVSVPHALLMGRYTLGAVSAMQIEGIPVNSRTLNQMRERWSEIRSALITEVDGPFGVYQDGKFVFSRFETYLAAQQIPWPRTPSRRLCFDDTTLEKQSSLYPQIQPLWELKRTLDALREIKISVGADSRNRTSLMPFASRTGRNQPSNRRYIFGLPKWTRSLIESPTGTALLMCDFSQQEFLIAAVLSRDSEMIAAYQSGDPYLHTAILAGAVPQGVNKNSHGQVRSIYKTAVLAMQYGAGAESLGVRLGNASLGHKVYSDHKKVYSVYHRWTDQQLDKVLLGDKLQTPFGWIIEKGAGEVNPRSVINWLVQATGAEILRMAAISLVEHGFRVAAPVHDALLVEVEAEHVEDARRKVVRLMREASEAVLGGFCCGVDVKVVLPGQAFPDESEGQYFNKVLSFLR